MQEFYPYFIREIEKRERTVVNIGKFCVSPKNLYTFNFHLLKKFYCIVQGISCTPVL
jgi:hypothetical protein